MYFKWDKFIPTLEKQFPDILNEVLNHDHQWPSSEQSVNRFTIARNGKSNNDPESRLSTGAKTFQPPIPRNTQPYARGAFHHGKSFSYTTP